MPNNIVKSYAEKTGKSVDAVEKEWNKAKEIASKEGHKEDYAYIVGILKKMLSINEDDENDEPNVNENIDSSKLTFRSYLNSFKS